MKKITFLFSILFILISNFAFSQSFNLTVTPQYQCFSGTSASVQAQVLTPAAGATQYTWAVGGGSLSGSVFTSGNGTMATVTFTSCGVYNIYCSAYNTTITPGFPVLITSTFVTATVVCTPSISIIGGNSVCQGSSLSWSAAGAMTYTWLPSGSTLSSYTITPTANTCYTLNGTSSAGCVGTAVKCITVSSQPTVTIAGGGTVCPGTSASFTASGAGTYIWFIGSSSYTGSVFSMTPTATTCFSVKGTSTNGCFTYTGSCITVQGSSLSITGPSVMCLGNSATLTAAGALTYTWLPGNLSGSSIVVSPTAGLCYTVIGNSGSTCNSYATKCISIGGSNTLTVAGGSFCPGQPRTLYATGAANYTWMPFNLTGSLIVVSPTASVCYTVTGVSSLGCVGTGTNCLVQASPPTISVSGPSTNCQGYNITLIASGASSYTWYPQNSTSSSAVVSPTANSCYTVVGASNGCTNAAVNCVTVLPTPTVSVVSSGSVCAGAVAGFTASGAASYIWFVGTTTLSGSSITIAPLSTTCYSVRGANSNNCPAYVGTCVTVPSGSLSISGPSVVCAGNSATLTASGALTYTWIPSNATGSTHVVTPTGNNCYTVIASDGTGCNVSLTKCISVSTGPTLSSGSGTFCAGQPKTIYATGALTYTWMPFNLTGSLVVVTPTSNVCFTVQGTNSLGCIGSATNCLTMTSPPSLTVTGPSTTCANSSITLQAYGAASYTWLPGNILGSPIVVNPSASTCYTVNGGIGGCIVTAVQCISVSPQPTITISGNAALCSSQSATLTASGANTYTWSTGSNASSIVAVASSSACYYVYGKNSSGCLNYAVKCLTVQSNFISISPPTATVCKGSSATFTANGAISYTWNTSATTNTVNILPTITNTYYVSGYSSAGCFGYATCVLVVDNTCSQVWPGDANSDGGVSLSDVFELGLAYNSTGPARTPGGNNWISQFANNWTGTISTGKNKCHADCNGNGVVGLSDTLAISQNFGLTHTFKPAPASANADVYFNPNSGSYAPDSWNEVDVVVDASSIGNHSGVGFMLTYDAADIVPDSAYLIYTASYLNGGNQNVEFRKYFLNNATIYAATVRTDGNDATIGGKIAEFHFKTKPLISSGTLIQMSLQDVISIDQSGQLKNPNGGTAAFSLGSTPTSIAENKASQFNVALGPIPVDRELKIKATQLSGLTTHFTLNDAYGRLVLQRTMTNNGGTLEQTVDVSTLSTGLYFVTFENNGKLLMQKIVISR